MLGKRILSFRWVSAFRHYCPKPAAIPTSAWEVTAANRALGSRSVIDCHCAIPILTFRNVGLHPIHIKIGTDWYQASP
jgi:hypothetical protein